MNNVYYVGSGELTFDLIERIINENLKFGTGLLKLKTGFRNAGITWTKRSRNPMSLSMASRQDSAACATIIFLPMN